MTSTRRTFVTAAGRKGATATARRFVVFADRPDELTGPYYRTDDEAKAIRFARGKSDFAIVVDLTTGATVFAAAGAKRVAEEATR